MSRTIKAQSTYPVERPSRSDIREYFTGPERASVRATLRKIVNDPTLADEVEVPTDQNRHSALWYWA